MNVAGRKKAGRKKAGRKKAGKQLEKETGRKED